MDDYMERAPRLRRLLVGNDGSDAANRALEWAVRLAKPRGAEVVIAQIFSSAEVEVNPEEFDELQGEARTKLERLAVDAVGSAGVPYRTVIEPGTPDGLLRLGDEFDVDLIVVGTRGEGGFAALHIGSTAHHLAHQAERPLAIIPIATAETPLERIVVGLDGSAHSAHVAAWTAELALNAHAEVIAVQSFEPLVEWVPEWDPRSVVAAVEHDLDVCADTMRARGVTVRTEVVKDIHPVAALAATVEHEGAGLVVVGRRGHGGFAGLLLGGVPERLIHQTQIPVVVIPTPSLDENETN